MMVLIDTKNVQLSLKWMTPEKIGQLHHDRVAIIEFILSLDSNLVPYVQLNSDEYNFLKNYL
ncbi:hypothetical protein F485_gp249 [Aeromonas phage CC2]|uniref:Uncharacterized protein n=1 Tax=Aeromonas phage CC2 TaxID=1204516 RepID=I6X6Y8_9CAUD|nr:hypothetical protein F485_gp249 [Aeromonas phage CC2]AFN39187.1 hypothetical protein CC2_046 [Aeromonas phage CC2]